MKVFLTRTSLHLLLDPWWNEGRPHDRPLPGGAKTSFTHDITTKYILIFPTKYILIFPTKYILIFPTKYILIVPISPCWCSPRCSLWLAAHFGTRGSKISWTQLIAKVGYFRGVVKVLTIFFYQVAFNFLRHPLTPQYATLYGPRYPQQWWWWSPNPWPWPSWTCNVLLASDDSPLTFFRCLEAVSSTSHSMLSTKPRWWPTGTDSPKIH